MQEIDIKLERFKTDQHKKNKANLSINEWWVKYIIEKAERANKLTLISHVPKFSHPDAKTTSIQFHKKEVKHTYLASGNLKLSSEFDICCTAELIPVYKLLSLALDDGKSIFTHLLEETDKIKHEFAQDKIPFSKLRRNFLSIQKTQEEDIITDRRVKQVYFPIRNNRAQYHLLSILSPSPLMSELNIRIENILKETKESKQKNTYHEHGFRELYDITTIKYGGAQPQNISGINSGNKGKFRLLSSIPPTISKDYVQLPKQNFFKHFDYIIRKDKDHYFANLNDLINNARNNLEVRTKLYDECMEQLIDKLIHVVWQIRIKGTNGWTDNTQLPEHQKIWLDNKYSDIRENQDKWLDEVMIEISRWILSYYNAKYTANLVWKKEYYDADYIAGEKLGNNWLYKFTKSIKDKKELLR